MRETKWLAGAFSAYGLCDVIGRSKPKISLFTSAETSDYVERFAELAGFGYVKPFKGRYHWVCDQESKVQAFYVAVSPHLTDAKRKMIEMAWEEWRRQKVDKSDGQTDPGPIDGVLYESLIDTEEGMTR